MNSDILPASTDDQAQDPPPRPLPAVVAPTSTFHGEAINILIVDDEPRNLLVLETVLDDPGYRLVQAESADQALLALVVEEFALLILDIRMPGMTGFELAQIIKERKKTARVPIIFLTAYYNEDQHMLEGYGTGAVDYLHKPVNPAILRSKVAVFAELYRKNRECGMANRALLAEVIERRRAEEALESLARKLIQVQEEERRRIARELHDELGMRLTCLKMDLSRLSGESSPKLEERVRSMIEQVETTIAAVQGLVAELRPGVLDDLGLVAALEWQCQDVERRSGIRCLVDSKEGDIMLDAAKATAAFRICQEALTNVLRHAGAKEIRVHLKKLEGVLLLEIHDDGQGILPEKITEMTSLGLFGMRERAEAVGGTFRIVGLPGQGTTVTVRVPCNEAKDTGMEREC